jgi:hypothetical protein
MCVCETAIQKQTNLTKTKIPVNDLPLLLKEPPLRVFLKATKTFCVRLYLFVYVDGDVSS